MNDQVEMSRALHAKSVGLFQYTPTPLLVVPSTKEDRVTISHGDKTLWSGTVSEYLETPSKNILITAGVTLYD